MLKLFVSHFDFLSWIIILIMHNHCQTLERSARLLELSVVLAFLSRFALSEPGQRLCSSLSFKSGLEAIQETQNLLEEALSHSGLLINSVERFPDLEPLLLEVGQSDFLGEQELFVLAVFLGQVRETREKLLAADLDESSRIKALVQDLPWPAKAWQGLQRCLNERGELRDQSSPELYSLRQEIRAIYQRCTKRVEQFLEKQEQLDYLQDEYLTISADRYVLAIKSNFKGRLKGIIHDYSQTGETCYLEPFFLIELNNQLQELKREEREAKVRVLRHLTELVQQEKEEISFLFDWLSKIDCLRAKVLFAQELGAAAIDVAHGNPVCLLAARHPILVIQGKKVQPVDLKLDQEHRGLVITGANSGGKTVCLKSLGLLLLMVRLGLPVPVAKGSVLPYFEHLFAFFGDEQNLEEDLSTFTAQIKQLKANWRKMRASSLVLLDEFGAGTDPSQGSALAQAVLDVLLQRGAWVVVATHFPALKVYGLNHKQVRVASVLFDPETKKPLFKLAYDQIGASQALDVAREYGLPEEIVRRAEQFLLLEGQDSSELISRLNDLALEKEQHSRKLLEEKDRLKRLQTRLQREYAEKIAELSEELSAYSREIMEKWRQGKLARKQALRELSRKKQVLQDQVRTGTSKGGLSWPEITFGQRLRYDIWGREGVVVQKDERKGQIQLNLGGVKVWANCQELSRVQDSEQLQREATTFLTPEPQSLILDLRGQRADEAENNLLKFVDQAILNGRNELEIIHGRGTGVLRSVVHEVLSRLPQIAHYHLAPDDRGGDGVTLVVLD